MIWEYMLTGLCHGAYVIGLLLSLGTLAGIAALFCLFMGAVFGEEKKRR